MNFHIFTCKKGSTVLFNYHRVTITLRFCCLAHCIDLRGFFLNLDSLARHVDLRTMQGLNFMVIAVSGMAELSTAN